MDTGSPPPPPTTAPARAGVWRRLLSLMIDGIIVNVPFQALAAVLFAATAGIIQMQGSFINFTYCQDGKDIPQNLNPPPPRDSNFISVCRTSFLGATTGATLTVGRVKKEGGTTTKVTQGYMLDKDGTPINGFSIDGIANLGLLIYLVLMIRHSGRTLGARVARVRVIDAANPGAIGVPLGKAILRYLAMFIGAVPMLAVLLYVYATTGGSADDMFTPGFFQIFAVTALFGLLWTLVLMIQIARKTDPVYDRLAGTAVVKS